MDFNMQIGLVGLQFSGKSKLFNTIAGIEENSQTGQKEEATIEVVPVPDKRVDELSGIFNPKKTIYATIEVFDTPGLKMSDDGKVKITTSFLNNVRNNDALFYVVRQFSNDSVSHPMSTVDPLRDIKFLESEFLFYDLVFLERRIIKLKKDLMKIRDSKLTVELSLIEKCFNHVENEKPLRLLGLSGDEKKILSGYQLLTLKPLMIAINFDEDSIGETETVLSKCREELPNVEIIPFFAEIEYELSMLDEEDRLSFMEDYGIKESALNKILGTSYEVLGLHSFFTVGEDECRAWTIKKNYTAQDAAGVIHTDFYNKFIRAEVVHYNDFITHKSFSKCKEAGSWNLEGKEYIVADGDILNIRHS